MDLRYKDPLYMKKWREENKQALKEYRRKRYLKHKAEEIAYATSWGKNNPERYAVQRKAVSANLRYPGTLTTSDIVSVVEKSDRTCCWCGKKNLKGRDLTLEHLKPINEQEHLAIACWKCNSKRLHRG